MQKRENKKRIPWNPLEERYGNAGKKTDKEEKKMKEKQKKETEDDGILGNDTMACSAQECTGLIPSLPEKEAEVENYQELFPYLAGTQYEEDTYSEESCGAKKESS